MTLPDFLLPIAALPPQQVWQHFAVLCAIPRASYQEQVLRDYLIQWADQLGIAHQVDQAGNLILRKPATAGYEHAPGVILQGHLDMVCQANTGTKHDFVRDPIHAVIKDGWVVAEHTTLGADNGVGVALALAVLAADHLAHPALEVLLTVNEECGMDGARGLVTGVLSGSYLINMDSEEWGHFYLGCAGGVDVTVDLPVESQAVPDGYWCYRLSVSGLRGGHSGIDIHLNAANAIILLAQQLKVLQTESPFCLVSLNGGTARNAIPREASAVIAVPAALDIDWSQQLQALQQQFGATDPALTLNFTPCEAHTSCLPEALAQQLLDFIVSVPNGVALYSEDFADVTDTSSNLGVAKVVNEQLQLIFKVRSLHNDRAATLAERLILHAARFALPALSSGAYPGWTPNIDSALLKICQQTYQEIFAETAGLKVIHAGLECGLLSTSHPKVDMISFGPNIERAHAPGERVDIESVAKCWSLLVAILAAIK